MKLPLLSDLLAYENEQIVRYFCHHYPAFSYEQAKQLFTDLLAWMWLNAYRRTSNRPSYLFGPLLSLDEMWHCFILHTRTYFSFCEHYFNDYFHHEIEPIGFEHQLSPDELADFLNDCFDHLDETWIYRYFTPILTED